MGWADSWAGGQDEQAGSSPFQRWGYCPGLGWGRGWGRDWPCEQVWGGKGRAIQAPTTLGSALILRAWARRLAS